MKLLNTQISLILFSAFLFTNLLIEDVLCQDKDDIVAKAGNFSITLEEFRLRYEFSPLPQRSGYCQYDKKSEFLYTLLAEKLLAAEAVKNELNKEKEFLDLINYLFEIYMRDALYQIEIKNKIIIPDSLMREGMNRIAKELYIKFIFSTNPLEIDSIFSMIVNGSDFDSLLNNRPEASEQAEIKKITFGEMHPSIENEIFKLLPGMITKPVKLEEGWYVCKIYDIKKNENMGKEDESRVRKIVSNRIEDSLYQVFYKEFFRGVNVNADREIFDRLLNILHAYVIKNQNYFSKNARFRFQLGEAEIKEIKNDLDSELKKIFIKFDSDPVSLDKFLIDLMYGGINFNSIDINHMRGVFSSRVREYIQNQLFVREAVKKGYSNLPEIQRDLKIWSDYYLSQLILKQLYLNAEVTEEEALDFYINENQVVQFLDSIKVARLVTGNLDIIESVLKKISDGERFIDICKEYDSNKILGTESFISEYFSVNENNDFGKIAARLNINEVYGPVKSGNGFLIIQLLDKKPGKKEKVGLFEEAKEDIKSILRTKRMFGSLDTLASTLALENPLKINQDLLDKFKVSDVNMIVLKRFGFGGQLLAVPDYQPYTTWYDLYLKRLKKNLP
jgi:hypothetical protein